MDLERIDHVAIVVKDLDESIHFYTKVMGMELDRILDLREFKLKVVFVTKDGADIELTKFEDPSIPIGIRHICALVSDVPGCSRTVAAGCGSCPASCSEFSRTLVHHDP